MTKESKYIHHPEYGYCVTCKHWNVPTYKEPRTSCCNWEKIDYRCWEPTINRELDEILGLKSNDQRK